MKNFRRVLSYIFCYKKNIGLNILFNVFYVVFSLFSLTLLMPVLSILFNTQKPITQLQTWAWSKESLSHNFGYYITTFISEKGRETALFYVCLLVIFMFFAKNICRYLALYFISSVRIQAIKNLQNDLYKKINTLDLGYFTQQRKGDILARMSVDVQEVNNQILGSIEALIRDPLNVIVFLVALFSMSYKLTFFVFLLLPVSGFIIGKIGQSLKKRSALGQQKFGEVLSTVEETIGGMRVIQGFSASGYTNNRFLALTEQLSKLNKNTIIRTELASPISEFLGSIVIAIIIWVGGKMVFGGSELAPHTFITYLVIFSQIMPPAKSVATVYNQIQRGLASCQRIFEVLDTPSSINNNANAPKITAFTQEIEFRNTTFSYPENTENALENISFTLKKGQTIALVGASGSGKSTLTDLLPRFIAPTSGGIFIDGADIAQLELSSLRQLFALVPQHSVLFHDTIENNIIFGLPHTTQAQVEAAAKAAFAHDFIQSLPSGYQTDVGEGGSKLSGGQRQRICIARAILRNAPILILDEATSALDSESEQYIQQALQGYMQNRTCIVVAHRLSTIQNAHHILVMQQGNIVEQGTHQQLLQIPNGLYQKFVLLQQI